MGRTLQKTVVLFDETTGEHITLMPGEPVPDHLAAQITNPAAWQAPPRDEFEDFGGRGYTAMKMVELTELAKERGIDLSGATKKEEIILRLESFDAAGR